MVSIILPQFGSKKESPVLARKQHGDTELALAFHFVLQYGYMRRSSFVPLEMKELGKYLRRLRSELGLSIRNVARRTKLSPSYISKLEDGDTFQTINVSVLIRFPQIYGISITALLKEAGFVHSDEDALPPLAQYLRRKYHHSPQAIRDMEMAKEIVDKKYGQAQAERKR